MPILSLIWSFAQSKLGIIVIAALLLGGFGLYHKTTMWIEQGKIASMEQEKNKALQDLYQERQKTANLEATIKFQRNQLSLQQKVKKETSDVKQAVTGNDRDYLYNNFNRLYNYKNPTTTNKNTSSNGKGLNPKAKIKAAD